MLKAFKKSSSRPGAGTRGAVYGGTESQMLEPISASRELGGLREWGFPIDILGQMWCFIISIPDLCPFSFFLTPLSLEGVGIFFLKIYVSENAFSSHFEALFIVVLLVLW